MLDNNKLFETILCINDDEHGEKFLVNFFTIYVIIGEVYFAMRRESLALVLQSSGKHISRAKGLLNQCIKLVMWYEDNWLYDSII